MKTVLTKVMWVGRATLAVGLAVILALILGFAMTALAAKKAPVLKNVADQMVSAVTGLKGGLTGAILKLDNDGSGTALQLEVQSGNAPMAVNSDGKVTNLNADKIDGQEASAFGIKTDHNAVPASDCDAPQIPNECAPVTVTVPDGKTYSVSVWSSFSARGDTQEQNVFLCSARRNPNQTTPQCITPLGLDNAVTLEANKIRTGASSGETLAQGPGTYTFSTSIRPEAPQQFVDSGASEAVITKVLVRNASNSF